MNAWVVTDARTASGPRARWHKSGCRFDGGENLVDWSERDQELAEQLRAEQNALLAGVMRRFLDFPGHPAEEPFVTTEFGDLLIDGRVSISDDERAAVDRASKPND